jgi:hypothetical protein
VPDLAADCISLTCWPANVTAKIIRPFRDFIFALDITDSGTRNQRLIRWSDAAAQGALPIASGFDYTDPTNQSGITELGQTSDALTDAVPLRDSLIVYKDFHTWRADYVGGGDVFQFREIFTQSGLLSNNCVALLDAEHLVFTDHDIIRHDGNQQQSIADKRIRKWIFNHIDTTYYKRSFAVVDHANNEALFCFPYSGLAAPSHAAVWNWTDNSWSIRELGHLRYFMVLGPLLGSSDKTIDGQALAIYKYTQPYDYVPYNALETVLITNAFGTKNFVQHGIGSDWEGSAMTVYAERTGLSLSGDMSKRKRVKRVYPRVSGDSGDTVDFYVGVQKTYGDGVTYSGPFTYTIDGKSPKIDCRISGVMVALKMVYTGSSNIRLTGYQVEYDQENNHVQWR